MIEDFTAELENPHPGVLLKEEYLDDMGITPYKLAKALGLSQIHVSELLKGKRNITPKTAYLLGKFFETTPDFWMNLQTHYNMVEEARGLGDRLDKVKSYRTLIAA
ncbi:MAG TPA: HigA family addiction module antitoxin [Capsulimonadaceae bacterium]|jgi:addiction module HigA family antidote